MASVKKAKTKTSCLSKPLPKAAPKKPSASAPLVKKQSSAFTFTVNAAPQLPARLQMALDKAEIRDAIADFCRGLDRLDETLLRSSSLSDATIDLGPGVFQGLFSDYIPWITDVLAQVRASHHMTGSSRIDIEGDAALVETYVQTYYRLDKPTGREDLFLGGRFLDRFERRPAGTGGAWKLAHRKHVLDWTRTETVSEVFYHQNPDALWSNRAKKDPSYQMAQTHGKDVKASSFTGRRFDSRSIKL